MMIVMMIMKMSGFLLGLAILRTTLGGSLVFLDFHN